MTSEPGLSTMAATISSPWMASGTPTTAAVATRGVLVKHLLDLAGVHVVAAADDHVLGPVDDEVVAVLVAAGQVSAAEPAVADGRCRGLGLVQLALHHVVSLDRDLTDLTLGNLDPLVVDELELHALDGLAYRAGLSDRSAWLNEASRPSHQRLAGPGIAALTDSDVLALWLPPDG